MRKKTIQREQRERNLTADPTSRIRQAILNGQLLPNERLVEQELVNQFQANRGAIRLALAVLEQQGLVVRELNRGARVRTVTESEAIEIMEMRAYAESLTARHAAARVQPKNVKKLMGMLEEMEDLSAKGDLIGYSTHNVLFHKEISEMSKHRLAEKILEQLRSQTVAFQYRPIFEPGRALQIDSEHRKLVKAIAQKNPDAAEAAMRLHLDNSVTALKHAIANNRVLLISARPRATVS